MSGLFPAVTAMAIGIKVTKTPERYDLGASKFFGTPTVPLAWAEDFCEDEIFFCQIRLADIAALDPQNLLPHTGYLYVFLHTEDGNWCLRADVRYHDGEPELALEEFNSAVPGYERYEEAWLMEFLPVEDHADCNRLLGVPSDWNYEEQPPKLLLQYDPLDSEMDFLDAMDGFVYLFFGADDRDFSSVTLHAEYT